MAHIVAFTRPLDGIASRARAISSALKRAIVRDPRLAIAFVIGVLVVGVGVFLHIAAIRPAEATPPAPPPMVVEQITPEKALVINATLPIADADNPAATAFRQTGDAASRAQALKCLSEAVYFEAGNQDIDGARAVAQVILNRVRHPAFPASICGVVYEGSTRFTGCQFTFTCDGSLSRRPDAAGWKRAEVVARAALAGSVYAPVGWATHYHANYVVPVWASTLAKNAIVGEHLFYHWAGGWGRPAAFAQGYTGREANAAALRNAALAVEARDVPRAPSGAPVSDVIDAIPGAEPIKLTPSMRGDKRVAVRFNQVARKAAEEAPKRDYAATFEASDTLKWALSEQSTASSEPPLGTAPAN